MRNAAHFWMIVSQLRLTAAPRTCGFSFSWSYVSLAAKNAKASPINHASVSEWHLHSIACLLLVIIPKITHTCDTQHCIIFRSENLISHHLLSRPPVTPRYRVRRRYTPLYRQERRSRVVSLRHSHSLYCIISTQPMGSLSPPPGQKSRRPTFSEKSRRLDFLRDEVELAHIIQVRDKRTLLPPESGRFRRPSPHSAYTYTPSGRSPARLVSFSWVPHP